MTKQRSWCCGFIPGFWWWFLTLLGLPLLFLLMTYFRQGVVEGDLTNRVSQALSTASMDWAEVDVKHRGRDVLIKGIPPSEDDRARALAVAQGIYGVNKVDFMADSGAGSAETAETENASDDDTSNADADNSVSGPTTADEGGTEPAIIMPTLTVAQRDGKTTLQGSLPSQQEIDGLVIAAGQRFGKDNVNNQLTVGEGVVTPEWLSSAGDILSVLPDEGAMLNISDQGVALGGEVNSDSDKRTLLSRANNLFGDGVTDKIVVKKLLPPEVAMAFANGQLTLSGKVASQQQVDTLLQVAVGRAGASNVVNKLEVSKEHGNAAWLDSVQQVVSNLLPENGSAKIGGGKLEISGKVDSEAARDQLITQAKQSMKNSGLTLVNNISLKAENSTVQSEETIQAAIQACQGKLDATMKDKNILFRVNKADIRNKSHALLDELAAILTTCNDVLGGKQIVIGGHTDSDGSERYNLELSQRRAEAVRTYLITKRISNGLLNAKGFGESQPVASNNTAAGKAQNRRISFEIKTAE